MTAGRDVGTARAVLQTQLSKSTQHVHGNTWKCGNLFFLIRRRLCIKKCNKLMMKFPASTHLHPVQPVSAPTPPRETSYVVTNYETENMLQIEQGAKRAMQS